MARAMPEPQYIAAEESTDYVHHAAWRSQAGSNGIFDFDLALLAPCGDAESCALEPGGVLRDTVGRGPFAMRPLANCNSTCNPISDILGERWSGQEVNQSDGE
jgi:hypothetical protein